MEECGRSTTRCFERSIRLLFSGQLGVVFVWLICHTKSNSSRNTKTQVSKLSASTQMRQWKTEEMLPSIMERDGSTFTKEERRRSPRSLALSDGPHAFLLDSKGNVVAIVESLRIKMMRTLPNGEERPTSGLDWSLERLFAEGSGTR